MANKIKTCLDCGKPISGFYSKRCKHCYIMHLNKPKQQKAEIDIIGKRFGKLTVVGFDRIRYKHVYFFKCECDCGNEIIVRKDLLTQGIQKGCDCVRIEVIRSSYGDASFNRVYKQYKDSARYRKHIFALSKKKFRNITSSNCYYCGQSPSQINRDGNHYGDYVHNGIDRLDNNKGYEEGNCVPCCITCNRAKLDMSIDEFKYAIKSIYNNFASK